MNKQTFPERLDAIEDEVEAYRADLVALREYIETGAKRQGE